MVSRVAKPACRWIGVLFLVIALAGWMDTPLVGKRGVIAADEALSIGHACVGAFLLVMSFGGESVCAFALYATGFACIGFGAYVLYGMGSYDSIRMGPSMLSRSGEYLHVALGAVMPVFGKMNTARQQLFRE